MKQAYSTYSTNCWPMFKQAFPKKTEIDFCRFASRIWLNACRNAPQFTDSMQWDRDSLYVDMETEFLWRFRKITHYFLSPGVADFCVSSVKEFSEEYSKRLPVCDPVDGPSGLDFPFVAPLSYFYIGAKDKIQGGFAVHFPVKERIRSVMVIPDAYIPVPPNGLSNNATGQGGMLRYYFVANDGDDTLLMQQNSDFKEFGSDDGTLWLGKMVFGLSLYMDAFPDSVVKADAENIHQIKHYEGCRHVVNRNEIVDEEHRHSVSPHWRRGHFRLRHDLYTNTGRLFMCAVLLLKVAHSTYWMTRLRCNAYHPSNRTPPLTGWGFLF